MYKAKRKKTNILMPILALILILALCGSAYMLFIKKPVGDKSAGIDGAYNEKGEFLSDGDVHELPENITFSVESRSFDEFESGNADPLEATIRVDIFPALARNKEVDWSVEFFNDESAWANGKNVSDYVTVTPQSDGASVATVSCYRPFGEEIKLTVTSRDNSSAKATCFIYFKQQIKDVGMYLISECGQASADIGTKHGILSANFDDAYTLYMSCYYVKSEVYTLAVNDHDYPLVVSVEYSDELAAALSGIKAGCAETPTVNQTGMGSTMNIFDSSLIEGCSAIEINQIITALSDNCLNSVFFIFSDTNGRELAKYTFDIDVSDLQEQYRVTMVDLDRYEIVFGEEPETYNITYMKAGSNNGITLFEIGSEYGLSKLDDGYYPETYTEGETVTISNLKSIFTCSGPDGDYHMGSGTGSASYQFNGWYLDGNKTMPFNGTIPAGTTGDITLYADIIALTSHSY